MFDMAIVDSEGNKDAISAHYPNDNLVSTIIRAWLDANFKRSLLSYPDATTPESWAARSKTPDYRKTSECLAEMGVYVEKPVVLTPEQYGFGYTKETCDVVYVCPHEPNEQHLPHARYSVDTARTAMKFCPLGM
jgi:hypothetical protein